MKTVTQTNPEVIFDNAIAIEQLETRLELASTVSKAKVKVEVEVES